MASEVKSPVYTENLYRLLYVSLLWNMSVKTKTTNCCCKSRVTAYLTRDLDQNLTRITIWYSMQPWRCSQYCFNSRDASIKKPGKLINRKLIRLNGKLIKSLPYRKRNRYHNIFYVQFYQLLYKQQKNLLVILILFVSKSFMY